MWFRYLNLIIVSLVPLLFSCDRGQALVEQPNILWLVSEDNGPFLGCYGDTFATTPNLDRLASEGILYKNRSEEHTSELQSLMRISYAVFCLKKKKNQHGVNK